MTTVSATEFKAKCLHMMDNVRFMKSEITITKHGKPIAKLVPVKKKPQKNILGCMAGTFTIVGDIISPIDVKWDAEKE
ncbi:MAG: type II toxin-antitoxin system prevent-host-death family antitoxin [Candidatus Gracilibacteria bacterium]|jgi:prevent-host-death family protein